MASSGGIQPVSVRAMDIVPGGSCLPHMLRRMSIAMVGVVGISLAPDRVSSAQGAVAFQGSPTTISSSGAHWPAVAYNPFSNQYLVLWVNVADPTGWQLKARRIDADTGALLGSEFHMSSDPASIGAVIGAVTYNPVNHEWFVAYQASINDAQDDILAQRIAGDGTKIGSHISLVVRPGAQNSVSVAHDPLSNRYLVAWQEQVSGTLQIFSHLYDAAGVSAGPEIRLSEVDNRLKFTPKVAYNPVVQEYMVIWEDLRHWPGSGQDNDYADIYGQRVNPQTGLKIGANIPVYAPIGPPYSPNGQDIPGGIACDTLTGRYAVGSQKFGGGAPGYNTVGLVVDSLGMAVAPVFNLSRPEFGAQPTPAYNPASGTYFITYEANVGVAGKMISPDGTVIGGEEAVISTIGSIRDNVLAVRPGDGQFLQVAVNDSGLLVAQRFTTGQAVRQFVVQPGYGSNTLSWLNPANADFTGTMIRYRTDRFPAGPADGILLADRAGTPGSSDGLVHTGLTNGTTYHYAAFAHNSTPVYAPPAFTSATPFLPGDFDLDNDVDQSDFAHLQTCFSGDLYIAAPGCEDADLDGDRDVDPADSAVFLECAGSPNQPPPC